MDTTPTEQPPQAQEHGRTRREPPAGPAGSRLLPDEPLQVSGDGCVRAVLLVLFGIWVLSVLAGIWIIAGWKSHYQVDVTAGRALPTDDGQALALLVVIGVPCVAATVVAVVLNRDGRRSRRAAVWAYVFAAIAVVSGALVWAWPTNISCRKVVGVTDIFSDYGSASCPNDYLDAANRAIAAIDWAAAGLVLAGLAAAVVTGAVVASGRKHPARPLALPAAQDVEHVDWSMRFGAPALALVLLVVASQPGVSRGYVPGSRHSVLGEVVLVFGAVLGAVLGLVAMYPGPTRSVGRHRVGGRRLGAVAVAIATVLLGVSVLFAIHNVAT